MPKTPSSKRSVKFTSGLAASPAATEVLVDEDVDEAAVPLELDPAPVPELVELVELVEDAARALNASKVLAPLVGLKGC